MLKVCYFYSEQTWEVIIIVSSVQTGFILNSRRAREIKYKKMSLRSSLNGGMLYNRALAFVGGGAGNLVRWKISNSWKT